MFDRFSQANSALTRRHGGLGIGLAIVRNLVEMHGGTVRAESAGSNRGTTLVVRLPLIAVRLKPGHGDGPSEGARAEAGPPTGSGLLNGLEVLIVDDHKDVLMLVGFVLKRHGARVVAAESVEAALSRLSTTHPDVILSDIGMPEASGYDLIARLRGAPNAAWRAIPAIALTAHARAEDRELALTSGFQEHLPKPVDARQLVCAIANLTGRGPMAASVT
jgi:CheY-like chemotaxis protein